MNCGLCMKMTSQILFQESKSQIPHLGGWGHRRRVQRGRLRKSALQKNTFWLINCDFRHTSYLSFFLHRQIFWKIKFTQYIANLHSKLPIFRVKSVKIYTFPDDVDFEEFLQSPEFNFAISLQSNRRLRRTRLLR